MATTNQNKQGNQSQTKRDEDGKFTDKNQSANRSSTSGSSSSNSDKR